MRLYCLNSYLLEYVTKALQRNRFVEIWEQAASAPNLFTWAHGFIRPSFLFVAPGRMCSKVMLHSICYASAFRSEEASAKSHKDTLWEKVAPRIELLYL